MSCLHFNIANVVSYLNINVKVSWSSLSGYEIFWKHSQGLLNTVYVTHCALLAACHTHARHCIPPFLWSAFDPCSKNEDWRDVTTLLFSRLPDRLAVSWLREAKCFIVSCKHITFPLLSSHEVLPLSVLCPWSNSFFSSRLLKIK